MYVKSPSPTAQFVQSLARLGGLVARGVSAASRRRRGKQEQAEALAALADGSALDSIGEADSGCGECAERRRQLMEEADRLYGGGR